MKFHMTKTSVQKTISYSTVAVVGVLTYFLLLNIDHIWGKFTMILGLLTPFFYGFAIAYILNMPQKFIEKHLSKFIKNLKLRRGLAITISLLLSILVLTALIAVVIPQLVDSITGLINNIPYYLNSAEQFIGDVFTKLNIDQKFFENTLISWEELFLKGKEMLGKFVPKVFVFATDVTSQLSNFILGIIISVYLLVSKENFFAQTKKVLYAILPKKFVTTFLGIMKKSHIIFSGFINGKLLDSLIIGIICLVCTLIMKTPYALLISVIVGVTNIIPFFGPFIGAIPSTLIIFLVRPDKALWFVIFIILLQQFDGNILGPKILSQSTGIPAFWVIFAILVFGGLFGFIGMFLGVPVLAVIYSLARTGIDILLTKKNMPLQTADYNNLAVVKKDENIS